MSRTIVFLVAGIGIVSVAISLTGRARSPLSTSNISESLGQDSRRSTGGAAQQSESAYALLEKYGKEHGITIGYDKENKTYHCVVQSSFFTNDPAADPDFVTKRGKAAEEALVRGMCEMVLYFESNCTMREVSEPFCESGDSQEKAICTTLMTSTSSMPISGFTVLQQAESWDSEVAGI